VNVLQTDGAGAPARWLVVFTTKSDRWWIRLIPGRFKHVRAFAYCHDTDCWIFYDPCLRTGILTARGAGARQLMLQWTRDAKVLSMEPGPHERIRPLPFACTTAIASLLGLPGGALRPDALYRQCLANGAKPLDEKPRPAPDCNPA
jgi:hypothetical protein